MKKPCSIVIAEDHTILREGLKSILSSHPDLKVVGEAGDGLEAIRCVRNHSPDMILLDLSMPRMTGLYAIKEIKRVSPQPRSSCSLSTRLRNTSLQQGDRRPSLYQC